MTSALPDAPVTTVEHDGDDARPLQDLSRTRSWARLEQVALGAFVVVPLLAGSRAASSSGATACRGATSSSAP